MTRSRENPLSWWLGSSLVFFLLLFGNRVLADEYQQTIQMFKEAKDSARFFDSAYGYAVFPSIGKAGFVVGGGYGKGRVYVQGRHVGNATVVDLSVGFQLGGQVFSEILFFEDERAFREFASGSFELGADAGVVIVTASAQVQVTTAGTSTTVAGGMNNAQTSGARYNKGMAVFVIPKGGLMYELTIGGQKFTYTPWP